MALTPPSYIAQITKENWDELDLELSNIHVVKAHKFSGADAGVKIAAAIAALPAGIGGLVDATMFPNPQNLSGFTIPEGVTVQLGPAFHTAAGPNPIIIRQGGRLYGSGCNSPGGTTIRLFNGLNRDIIQCLSTGGEGGWWHHGEIKNIRLLGNKGANTTGNCISLFSCAETSLIQRVNIEDAPQVGLYIKGSQSGTGSLENITVNKSGLYGIQLDQFRSALTLKCVGGDQNPVTFAITNPTLGGGSILLIDPKSEGTTTSDPNPCVLITGGSAKVTLTIMGGNFLTPNQNKTAIRIAADVGVNPGLQIMGLFTGNHMPTLIDDLKNTQTVTTAPSTYHQFLAYCGGKYARFDENGFFTQA